MKKWKKPKLIVLYRRTSGENVIMGCKSVGDGLGGPVSNDVRCYFSNQSNRLNCKLCYQWVYS